MVYILEAEFNLNKSLRYNFFNVYGLNKSNSNYICKSMGISSNFKTINLNQKLIKKLNKIVNEKSFLINNDLKKKNIFLLKKIVDIKLYKGLRRLNGYPIKGQRTRTNAKTAKKLNKKNF